MTIVHIIILFHIIYIPKNRQKANGKTDAAIIPKMGVDETKFLYLLNYSHM